MNELILRPMEERDIESIVDIIELHDDDDARIAFYSFKSYGTTGHFVLADRKDIARGVTGVFPGNAFSYWLSWTYLDQAYRGQGWGRKLGEKALQMVKDEGGYLLFISTSDYQHKGRDIYADAKRFYLAMGAEEEMQIPNYFQRGEAHCVYRLEVRDFSDLDCIEDQALVIQFTGMEPIKETKVAFALLWDEAPNDRIAGIEKEIQKLKKAASLQYSHAIFFSVPRDFNSAQKKLVGRLGFQQVGKLRDYFGPGMDELHFGMNL